MRMIVTLFLFLAGGSYAYASTPPNELPQEAAQALTGSTEAIIFSLEPEASKAAAGEKLHTFLVLGKTKLTSEQTHAAAKIYEDAIRAWNNGDHAIAACLFEPRHALQVKANGHTYDFLACYHCGQLEVFDGDKDIASFEIRGSPDVLNGLLTAAHIPLSKTSH